MLFGRLPIQKKTLQFETRHISNGNVSHVTLTGAITETGGQQLEKILSFLQESPDSEVVFSLANVTFMNSIGIHQWAQFLKKISPTRPIYFEECSPEVVEHINLLPAFRGRAKVRSFQMPYACPGCRAHSRVLARAAEIPKGTQPVPPKCRCGRILELEEPEDDYFRFLEDL